LGTIKKRFDAINIASTPQTHASYRELLFSTPGIEQYISGVILFEETILQNNSQGIPFANMLSSRGIVPGIKVDLGTTDLPETRQEKITLGLDKLQERVTLYKAKGAQFAKWRAVFAISPDTPSDVAIEENARVLAEYAIICQRHNIVPIVEPEIIREGDHTIEVCAEVTTRVQKTVFAELSRHGVFLPGMLLKPNMVTPGADSTQETTAPQIAAKTIEVLKNTVDATTGGVVFLSGGEEPEQAADYLNEMNKVQGLPWRLTFSFGRALQDEALHAWGGVTTQVGHAQELFARRARLTSLASSGGYNIEMEKQV
jgi:fructose-bisphosphate aldolase class I